MLVIAYYIKKDNAQNNVGRHVRYGKPEDKPPEIAVFFNFQLVANPLYRHMNIVNEVNEKLYHQLIIKLRKNKPRLLAREFLTGLALMV